MRRANSRRAGGTRSSATRPAPRAARKSGLALEKTLTRKSVTPIAAQPVDAPGGAERREERGSPTDARSLRATSAASSAASRKPRFSPWPATGCSVCAALPIATTRGPGDVRPAVPEPERKTRCAGRRRSKRPSRAPKPRGERARKRSPFASSRPGARAAGTSRRARASRPRTAAARAGRRR